MLVELRYLSSSTIGPILGLGRFKVTVDYVSRSNFIPLYTLTGPFLCAQRAAVMNRSGWLRAVIRRGTRDMDISMHPLEGTLGDVVSPTHILTHPPSICLAVGEVLLRVGFRVVVCWPCGVAAGA